MKKLPYGISNYERLINENYYYVDKTKYIEKLEDFAETNIMFLRPRKFGKTLFTSTLEYYYDINAKDKFETLFGSTYIGKNPTELRNSYYILRFNFSGIDTVTDEEVIESFKNNVILGINSFIDNYHIKFEINNAQPAEAILGWLFEAFRFQKPQEKIYVIIDEYDHFANELLGFQPDKFKKLVTRNGKVRKWYEVLKRGTESVVDRIFITGVAPITLDSLTSGFNICSDKTRDEWLNEMIGFTEQELKQMMNELTLNEEKQEMLMPILKENYDGYKFSIYGKENVYNSNLCLYLLNDYTRLNRIPEKLVDMNIASDYGKLNNMLKLCRGEKRIDILEKTVTGEGVIGDLTEKFNPEMDFEENELISMLYYLGYLTITGERLGRYEFNVPNKVMKEIYSEYFLKIINEETNLRIDNNEYNEILEEVAIHGKIDKLVKKVGEYLNNLSNRDYQKFDEKYVKIIFYSIVMTMKIYSVKSEPEISRKYPDILMVPRDVNKGYQAIMVEFKYLKAHEKGKLTEKQKEAREQIEEYSKLEDICHINNLNKYTIVAVNDEIFMECIQ